MKNILKGECGWERNEYVAECSAWANPIRKCETVEYVDELALIVKGKERQELIDKAEEVMEMIAE